MNFIDPKTNRYVFLGQYLDELSKEELYNACTWALKRINQLESDSQRDSQTIQAFMGDVINLRFGKP